MNRIESKMFYGDKTEVFQTLIGFKIVDVEATHTNEEKEPVTVIKCVNQNHVEIDVIIQESGVFVTEPFAVREDLSVVDD